jgi:O-antigen/teichoic acid export membrane protein
VALVFVANVVTTFGTDMVLIRDIAGAGRTDRWAAALGVQLVLSAGAIGLIWVAAPVVPGQDAAVVAALRVYSLSLLPAALFSVCSAALRGVGQMSWYAAIGAALAAMQLGAIWAFVTPGIGLAAVAIVLLAVQVVTGAAAFGVCAVLIPGFRRRPVLAASDVASMARASVSIGALGLLGVLYQRAGILALSVATGPSTTGWFAASSRVVEASKSGHVALFAAVYPAMAAAHPPRPAQDGAQDAEQDAAPDSGLPNARSPESTSLGRTWRVAVTGAAAISGVLVVGSSVVIGLLYGPAFAPASGALAILGLTLVPSTIATYRSLELLASHREDRTLRALSLAILAMVLLLAILIPLVGWIGACWAILGAEVVQAGSMVYFGRERPAVTSRPAQLLAPSPRTMELVRELPEPS